MIQDKIDEYLTDEGVVFEYTVWECEGNYEVKPYHAIEINKMTYNGNDVTDLLFNIADKYVGIIKEKIEESDKS
tara:strand:- start:547 stop:768 length:222 start_codon:yes stop_codon:yes gene_type:complete